MGKWKNNLKKSKICLENIVIGRLKYVAQCDEVSLFSLDKKMRSCKDTLQKGQVYNTGICDV